MHRDIKPENFLLGAPTLLSAPAGTAARVLKISDFGVSAFFEPGKVSTWLQEASSSHACCLLVPSCMRAFMQACCACGHTSGLALWYHAGCGRWPPWHSDKEAEPRLHDAKFCLTQGHCQLQGY